MQHATILNCLDPAIGMKGKHDRTSITATSLEAQNGFAVYLSLTLLLAHQHPFVRSSLELLDLISKLLLKSRIILFNLG
ncbi:hypothetical protein DSO57_1019081 [Entomophthora muscae]|uniref:Uncharacterized protein n=1 Tax=Entomophthora muscae TaxID=34485 RepID=A0ACC2ST09_9FUNG|nr:hypothetical protein DSO57_1019081 [Entomophthora muscae]